MIFAAIPLAKLYFSNHGAIFRVTGETRAIIAIAYQTY